MAANTCSSALTALSSLVAAVCKSVSIARDADEVKGALHSVASLLHLSDRHYTPGYVAVSSELAQLTSDCYDEVNRISRDKTSTEVFKSFFYGSASFPILAKVLLFHVAPDWLTCFSAAEQEIYFDSFFRMAPTTEALLSLVHALTPNYSIIENGQIAEKYTVCKVAERLLVLCLFEDGGLRKLVTERVNDEDFPSGQKQTSSTPIQLIASIPDRVRPDSPSAFLSPNFYLSATSNFLEAIEEYWASQVESNRISKVPFINAAELFSRFCRRGHADIVASAMICKLLKYVEQNNDIIKRTGIDQKDETKTMDHACKQHTQSSYLQVLMGCMNDTYAIERLTKALLLEMAERQLKDHEAYHILCILFSCVFENQDSVRSLFTDRFLFWTVLPICCLRWIMQFAVFRSPLENKPMGHTSKVNMGHSQKEAIRHIIEVWAEEKFITTVEIQQQLYVTVAVSLSLQAITKEDLQSTDSLLQPLLKGISRRLESPLELVRKMAKRVALAFSLIINESEPLLLEDGDNVEDLCDWEELNMHKKSGRLKTSYAANKDVAEVVNNEKIDEATVNSDSNSKQSKPDLGPIDPDEVIDLSTYTLNDDEDSSDYSDTQSECSIQPYDLSDDDSDLQRVKLPMQLSECCSNLRKGDEPDLVEKVLDVVEKLIRTMPEELQNVASDLAHALIHVRCSDIAVEGQEETAEEKRYKALVALLACAPLTVKKFVDELYSPHMDVGQRLLVLQVMSDAARELSAINSTDGSVSNGSLECGHAQHSIMEIDRTWYGPGYDSKPFGAGPWREVIESNATVSLVRKYEREIPYQQLKFKPAGRSRRWGQKSMELRAKQYRHSNHQFTRINNFVPYAAAFMLPVMRDFDKIQHGVDLLGRDFVFLGRLIFMLGECIECVSFHPEALILGSALLDMLRSRRISNHPEAYVKRAILYAVSRVIVALHPSHITSAVNSKNLELLDGLDWIRAWTMEIMNDSSDTECSSMALACLNMLSELFMHTSRCLPS